MIGLALVILIPALAMAGLALRCRARLAAMALTTWLGWLLIGAGGPVLAGQLASLALTGRAEARIAECQAATGLACETESLILILPLTAGLCGGLGWIAGAVAARLGR